MKYDLDEHVNNFLNDVTTALPYSDYIRRNVGNYVILKDKSGIDQPWVVKGFAFRHTVDHAAKTPVYIIQCFVKLDNTRDDAYFSLYYSQDLILQLMDNPQILIDQINASLRKELKFIAKNKTTDLLFKSEG